jgi:thioredoxin-like negative regulator of GroEL
MSGVDVSVEEHERLALAMLAVEAGDLADLKDAMWKVIAAAPAGTDVALVLSRALAHAGDRALRVEPLLVTIRGSRGASSASPCAL